MQSVTRRYLYPIAVLVAAIGLRLVLDPVMGDTLPLVTMFGAIAFVVVISGYRAAIVAAVAGYLACAFYFIQPRGSIGLSWTNLVGLGAYLFTCAIIIALGEAMRRSRYAELEQRETFRVALRSIGDAVITTDNAGDITYMNGTAEALTGWDLGSAMGKPLSEVFRIINEGSRQSVESPATRALREGTVVGLANHTLLIKRSGEECPIDDSAAPITDEDGNVSGCVLIFRDVTVQRQAERERAIQFTAARLLAAIVESSEDAIVSKNLDGIIQTWNAGAERMFGFTAAEAIGRHISLIIPPERISEEDMIIAKMRAGERLEHVETERRRSDGTHVFVSLTISPVRDETGKIIGASKIARDISERRHADDELRRLAASLADADQRKNEFLATLAHELRNPLAPITNMVDVLNRTSEKTPTATRALATIDRQLKQMVRLIEDLLDLSRITHNRLDLRVYQVDLESVVNDAIEATRPLIQEAHHTLQVSMPTGPIYLKADPARLSQVFSNLLSNSTKYTHPGGRIWLSIDAGEEEVTVSVRDTGIGIPPEKLDSVFEMFSQLDRSLERTQGGLGIGLALVKRLVAMHGGSIEARSEGEGKGSEFVVRLPRLARDAIVPETEAPVRANPATKTRRILVVDDNEDAAASLAMLLQLTGNDTHVAHDGEAAIQAIESYRPQVVLLDIGMPRISGYDVCRHVRTQPWSKDLILVALTGWGQEDDRRRSREAGFDGHLVKPVEFQALQTLLATLDPPDRSADAS